MKTKVRAYRRKGKPVRSYLRTKRGLGKKRIVGKPVKLYPVYDEYHQWLGWKK